MDVCLGLTCWKPDLAQPDDDFISLSYLKAAASLSRKQSLFPLCLTPQDVGITLQIPLPVYKSWLLAAWQKKMRKYEDWRGNYLSFSLEAANKMCLCVYSWLTSKVGMVSSGLLLTFSSHPLVWCYWVQQVILAGFKTALFIQSDAIRGNTLCCIVSSNRRFVDL